MSAVNQPVGWQPPRMGGEHATREWLDALSNGSCDQNTFLHAMQQQLRSDPDGSWEVLSLLDQYYRRGKIKAEAFLAIKSRLEGVALGANEDTAAGTEPPASAVVTAPVTPAHETIRAPAPGPATASVRASVPLPAAPVPVSAPVRGPAPASAATPAPVRAAPTSARAPVSAPIGVRAADVGARAATRDLAPDDVLRGRYRILRVLGQGGMGTVFEAIDEYRLDLATDDQRLAIKVLHTAVTMRAELLVELRREFQHLQLLSHPNIVRVHEFDRDGDLAFFTMELLSGRLLSRVLSARHAVPLERPHAAAIIYDVGAALAYAHSRGVVHGDINPQNIFITGDGEVRVLDFGASHKMLRADLNPDDELQRTPVATLGYASCQVLEGNHPDARDDLFAFACVVYLLLTGRHPFAQRSAIEARTHRLKPKRPSGLKSHQWRALLAGLHWERERRPSDIQEWLRRLDLHGAARRLPTLSVLLRTPPPRQHKYVWGAAVIAAIALIVGTGYWATTARVAPDQGATTWQDGIKSAVESSAAFITNLVNKMRPNADNPQDEDKVAAGDTAPPPGAAQVPGSAAGSPAITQLAPPTGPAATAASSKSSVPQSSASHAAHAKAIAPTPAARVTAAAPPISDKPIPAGKPWPSRIELATDTIDVPPGEPSAQIAVSRKGSLRGDVSFSWWTESGTAKPGLDFAAVSPRIEHIADRSKGVILTVPLTSSVRSRPKSFYVVIDQPGGDDAVLGARTLTMVTLQPPD